MGLVVMTTFYYYSVNHQSGLQRNAFSKLSYIFWYIKMCRILWHIFWGIWCFHRSKDFEAMKAGKLTIRPWLSCQYTKNMLKLLIFLNTAGVSRQHQKNSSKPNFTKWLGVELELCSRYFTHLASHWVIMVIISNYGLISKKCCSLKYFERLVFFAVSLNRGR
jgi:hypothetical protein